LFEETRLSNIANYYFVYAVPITTGLTVMCLLKSRHFAVKAALVALLIFQLYFLFSAQYALSVLIALIGLALELFVSAESPVGKTLIVFGFLFIVLIFPQLFMFLINHVSSTQLALRLQEVYDFLVNRDSSGYNFNGRIELYQKALIMFLKSPIIGVYHSGINAHGTVWTYLSDVGLLGSLPLFYLYGRSYNHVKRFLGTSSVEFKPIFTMLVLMGLTNPLQAALPVMFSVWFLAPLTIHLLQKEHPIWALPPEETPKQNPA
jgi:hypothetical protein